jgi:hypothetical protein
LGKNSAATQVGNSRHHQFSGGPAMNLNPATVLNPVFNALDALIQNYGVYLYLVFVWLSLGAIAWVLGGGLRRRRTTRKLCHGHSRHHHHDTTADQSPPPTVITEVDPVQNDDNEIMDEP